MRRRVTIAVPAGRGSESVRALLRSLARARAEHPAAEPPGVTVSVGRRCAWSDQMDKLTEIWSAAGGSLQWVASDRTQATAMRNRAADCVRTPWIAFLDDDVVVDPCYLRELDALLTDPPAPVVQGVPYLCSNPHRLLARLEASNYAEGLKTYLRDSGSLITLDARNLLLRSDLIRRHPFDERLLFAGEGQDLAARLEAAGVPMAYAEQLRVYHHNRETLPELARQKYFHGRGRAQLLRHQDDLHLPRYLARYAVRHFVEPVKGMATRRMPASEGLYRLATNTVFWTGVLREMASGRTQ